MMAADRSPLTQHLVNAVGEVQQLLVAQRLDQIDQFSAQSLEGALRQA